MNKGNGKPRVVLYKIDPISVLRFTAGVYAKGWCSVESTAENRLRIVCKRYGTVR